MRDSKKSTKVTRARGLVVFALALLSMPFWISLVAQEPKAEMGPIPEIKPQIPTADRTNENRVFLEHADVLHKQEYDSFMILTGNVQFSRGGMMMYCDSAHFYPEIESIDAFGNVRMEQGDTLFIYGDSLEYRSTTQLAKLFGNPAKMINNDVMLETDEFIYDLQIEYGYYVVSGVLTDKQNRLFSMEGEYIPSTKEASFYTDVKLRSISDDKDSLFIYTDTLYYNTDTHIAELYSPSEIINKGDTIFTTNGNYDTNTQIANLYDRSLVKMGRGTTLSGDTLFYDKVAGFGWARGNMLMTDSIRQSALAGEYGYYDMNIDSAYVTGRALAMEYSRGDTLYMHGKEIFSFMRFETVEVPEDTINNIPAHERVDSLHYVITYPRVRFYRSDMQGVCDSMVFEQKDSTLYMFRAPIVWNQNRQIFGNLIMLHLNDSTFDRATLPDFGFSAELIEEGYYNQLSGKEMIAYFEDSEMKQLDVNGNVEAIMMPMENDSTYNKVINLESSYLTATFANQALIKMRTWPETSGTVTPLYLAKKSLFFLPKFRWFTGIRPTSPEDIFIVPPEMDELMATAVTTLKPQPADAKRKVPMAAAEMPTAQAPQLEIPEAVDAASETETTEPEAIEPLATEPEQIEPVATEPVATDPEPTEPAADPQQ